MEVENTTSPLGLWEEESLLEGYSGSGYLRFMGNTFETGPANSPIEYNFRINQGGVYYLHLHCAKETIEGRNDIANDCYVRVEGDYTAGPNAGNDHGDDAPLSLLTSDTKYFGGASNRWKWENGRDSSGGAGNLDPGGHSNKRVAAYTFKAGENYKLVVSGRSKFFRINRIVFRHSSTSEALAEDLETPESATLSGEGTGESYVYDATSDFPGLTSGDVPYYVDNGNDALAIAANIVANRTGFARASRTFDGVSGAYDVTITTMTEEDGESSYRLLVNGEQVGTYTNPFVFDPPESPLDLLPNTHTWSGISIPSGASIAIESNADTNGQIPENGGTAWARGRWQQIELAPSVVLVEPPAGRLAYVADGNSPDPDDIGANAVIFGLLGSTGLQDRLVHFSHSCDLDPFLSTGRQSIDVANEQRRQDYLHQTAGEGVGFFGPFPNLVDYYNCRTEQTSAVNDLRDAINASSAADPLWIIEAGEPDIIGYALQAANASKRQYVHVISHHPANDNSGDFFTWAEILGLGVTEHQIGDQNVGLQVQITSGLWDWAEAHPDPRMGWILDQLKYAEEDGVVAFQSNKYDCSDAGMLYWWITGGSAGGDRNSTPVEIREMLLYEGAAGSQSLRPVAHWPLDEGVGTVADDVSGFGWNGALLNGASWGSDAVRGSHVVFDGTNDRISTAFTYALSAEDDFTWTWWAKMAPGSHANSVMVGNRYGSSGSENFEFIKLTPSKGAFANTDSTGAIENYDYANLSSGTWHHYAMVKVGGSYQWYVDGVAQGAPVSLSYDEDTPLPFLIGGDDDGSGTKVNEHFEGAIDDVVVYRHALTPQEVVNVGNGIYTPEIFMTSLGTPVVLTDDDIWSDGLAAHAGARYVVPATGNLRSQVGTSSFPGEALTVRAGGKFQVRAIETDVTTVDDLILEGGQSFGAGDFVQLTAGTGSGVTNVLDGKIMQRGATRLVSYGGSIARQLRILSEISGEGVLQATGEGVEITNSANSFSGNWEAAGSLVFGNSGAVGAADIDVLDGGSLSIAGDWNANASLSVWDGAGTLVDLSTHTWSVNRLTLGSGNLPDGSYSSTELDALSAASFIGSGMIVVDDGIEYPSVADDQNLTLTEDSSIGITLTGFDADGDPLDFVIGSQPGSGLLSGSAPNLTYTPNPNFAGQDSFTFTVNDSEVATISMTVSPVNDPSIANGGSASVDEDGSVGITLTGFDVDGDVLSFAVVSQPSSGTVGGSAPNLIYTPNPDFSGQDGFSFTVNDSAPAAVEITVNPVNDPSVANSGSSSVDEDASVEISLTGSDVDDDPLNFVVVSAPSNGSLSGSPPSLTYTPSPDFAGQDSIRFTVNDSAVATVTITVNPVNDVPTAASIAVETNESEPVEVVLGGDDRDGDSLSYSLESDPANGVLSGTPPNLVYTPNSFFDGEDSFAYSVSDGSEESDTATVSIIVNDTLPPRQEFIDNQDLRLNFSGNWNTQFDVEDYDGSMSWSAAAGDFVEYTFEGTLVQVGVRFGRSGGTCNVFVDNELVAENVDTYSAEKVHQSIIYEGALDPGVHTVRLEATGEKNASALQPNIMFDFIYVANIVTERIENTSEELDYLGEWTVQDATADSGGSMTWSRNAGDSVAYEFTGDRVVVVVRTGPFGGACTVKLDGDVVAPSVDTNANPAANEVEIYDSGPLEYGTYTIELVSESGGNTMFDYFDIEK